MWVTDDRWLVLDTVFRVVSDDEEAADSIREALGGFERTRRPARAAHILQITRSSDGKVTAYNDCRRFSSSASDWDEFLTSAVAVINNSAIERCPHFAVHSAVVSNGRAALALPAATGGGKSTIAGALVRAGLLYLSDEALVVSDQGEVISYPKPVALTPWSAESLGLTHNDHERLVMPSELGGRTGQGSLPLGDIIMMDRAEGEPRLEDASRSQAMTALIKYSFNHYKDPERAFRLSSELARSARAWRLTCDDPVAAAALVADRLG